MLKSEAVEMIGLLQHFAEWEISPSLKSEMETAIVFYQKAGGLKK